MVFSTPYVGGPGNIDFWSLPWWRRLFVRRPVPGRGYHRTLPVKACDVSFAEVAAAIAAMSRFMSVAEATRRLTAALNGIYSDPSWYVMRDLEAPDGLGC